MPFKNKQDYNRYMRNYMRERYYSPDIKKMQSDFAKMEKELTRLRKQLQKGK